MIRFVVGLIVVVVVAARNNSAKIAIDSVITIICR